MPPASRARLVTPSRTQVIMPSKELTNKATMPTNDAMIPSAPVKMA